MNIVEYALRKIGAGIICLFSFLLICILISPTSLHADEQPETVILQLKWFHQFQFAGYYAAKEKGFWITFIIVASIMYWINK